MSYSSSNWRFSFSWHRHFSSLPIMLTIEPSRMVNTFRARSSISFEQMSLWCVFLDPHLMIHHLNIVTQIRWVPNLGILTLGLMRIFFIFWQVRRTYENPLGYYDSEFTKNVRDWKEVFDIRPRSDYNTGVKVGTGIHKNQWPSTPPNVRCVIPTEVVTKCMIPKDEPIWSLKLTTLLEVIFSYVMKSVIYWAVG